ncbi:MAG: hypothetical protein P8M50_00290 [Paracoccaceae bacterium]|nr:hypothetical protein [Paracoccaceae bacterium]
MRIRLPEIIIVFVLAACGIKGSPLPPIADENNLPISSQFEIQ